MSDDFNYTFNAVNSAADIGGTGKWKNFFHNSWTGPGPTIWRNDAASVSGGNLRLKASRATGEVKAPYTYATRMGCISSYNKIKFPCFVEARVFVMDSQLATNVWLLSPSSPSDDQEIDIIECYGGKGANNNNAYFADRIHLSHHAFNKTGVYADYQPTDLGSWWQRNDVTNAAATDPLKGQWGGRWVRVGVYWVSGNEWRYYVDGVHVRTVKHKAFQTKNINNVWEYRYPYFNADGSISKTGGYQNVKTATSLDAAIAASTFNVIDPYNNMNNNYQITKELEIIINQEDQSWQADAGRSPSNTEITDATKHTMLVDWVRAYTLSGTAAKFGDETPTKEAIETVNNVGIYPNPASNVINVLALESNTISIYNANGTKVLEQLVPFGYYQAVDISSLSKGIYFVKNGSASTKLVVNK